MQEQRTAHSKLQAAGCLRLSASLTATAFKLGAVASQLNEASSCPLGIQRCLRMWSSQIQKRGLALGCAGAASGASMSLSARSMAATAFLLG